MAWFHFAFAIADHMDDGGCYAGHPLWAVAEGGFAVAGTVSAWVSLVASVRYERGRATADWALTALALSVLCAAIWIAFITHAPASEIVRPEC